jgi:rSAM/selenodomain-associated transferase 1
LADNRGVSATSPSLLLFARAPEAGRVKTRLEPALGQECAARLYGAFLEDAARCYAPSAAWSAVLFADPDPSSPCFTRLFSPPWRARAQTPGDLGERLTAAFRAEFLLGAPSAVAVGSDHPALPRRRILEMFESLGQGAPAVVIPADDGGYCAIGLLRSSPVEEVFREVPWSSGEVLAVTLARVAGAGLRAALLPSSYDVDRPEDVARLAADVAARDPGEPDYPSATAAALAALTRPRLP